MINQQRHRKFSRLLLIQIAVSVFLIAAVVFVVQFLMSTANENAKKVAQKNAEVSMKIDVENVISRIDTLRKQKRELSQVEIHHVIEILSAANEDQILDAAADSISYLDQSGGEAVPSLEITDASGTPVYQSDSLSADSEDAILKETLQVGSYTVTAYTSQAKIDEIVKQEIHDEIHNTQYGNNQYVWVNEVVDFDGGDNYAIRRIHPNLSDTEGIYLSTSIQDAAGNYPYKSELEGIKANGEIYQTYYFKNLDDGKIALKYSYAKLYEPYSWIIATGIPLSNLYSVPNELEQQNTVIGRAVIAASVFLVLLLSSVTVIISRKNEQIRKAKEEANQILLSSVSHDMRTPMNAIISYSGNDLNQDCSEAELRENMKKINSSASSLMVLINDLLMSSKFNITERQLNLAPVTIRGCVQPVYDIVLPRISAKHQYFSITYHEIDSAMTVSADADRIRQILINLVNNASKYTPDQGTISLEIYGTADQSSRTVSLQMHVIDNGIGIAREKMNVIFEPFSQLNAKSSEGIGMGLSIVKSLVNAMKGTITVESEPGAGSDFTVSLKLKMAELPKTNSELTLDVHSLAGKRILVAEDNELNRDIVEKLLAMKGMICVSAENGKQALETFQSSPEGTYDCILMDVRMPVMDGLEAARAIRALARPDGKTVPIIAMTADVLPEDVEKCVDAGMNAHVSKPIYSQVLFSTLSTQIGHGK
jgi:signal transduction histidine kinase/BarA-like signal transduction histidine kinase